MIYSSSRYVLIGNIVLPDFPISIFMVNVLFLKGFVCYRISDHNNRANTVLHTVITDGSKPAFGAPAGSAEASAPHYHSAEPKPLDLQAQPLLHVVLLLRLLVRRRRLRHDGEVDGAPIGAVEHGGGADVEQDHGVARSEVVLDRPLHGVRALVAQIDGDGDFPLRPPGREARGGWLRHSKNNNDLAFFTYDEKRKLGYGTQKERLEKDSIKPFDA
nr:Os07g0551501 [Ipomoea trifida]